MTPTEAANKLGELVKKAKNDGLDFYTPTYYQAVQELYTKVNKLLGNDNNKPAIIENVARGDRLLAKAYIKKKEVESALPELLKTKSNLDKLNTATTFPKEYKTEMDKLAELVKQVVQGESDKINEKKEKLGKSMKTLEVKMIRYTALNKAYEIKEQAKKENAIKLAPKTYAEAINVYQAAETSINNSPYDTAVVNAAGASAMFAARHALYVTERVAQLQNNFKDNAEQVVTSEENLLLKISKSINGNDYRNNPYKKQIELIVNDATALNSLKKSNSKNESEIKKLSDELEKLKKQLTEANASLKKSKADLEERNNQVVKLTADLVQLQNSKKSRSKESTNSQKEKTETKVNTKNKENSTQVENTGNEEKPTTTKSSTSEHQSTDK